MTTPSVLFVCLGNICRSPTAEAVFRQRARNAGIDVIIDSAGTGRWHQGDPPDPRAIIAGSARGYDFIGQAARQVEINDFFTFDYILAMDGQNRNKLLSLCPPQKQDKIQLFMDYAPELGHRFVPDPYYGGDDGFNNVLDMIEAASDGFIRALSNR